MLFQAVYRPNYGFALFEAIAAVLILLLILNFMINLFFKEDKSLTRIYKNSLGISCLIIFGIIMGIRFIFETLGMWTPIFRILNNDHFYFALMTTIFFPLHKPILRKFGFSRASNENNSKNFNKLLIIFIGITWVVVILSFSFYEFFFVWNTFELINNPNIFNLNIFWTVVIVLFSIAITYLINQTLSKEKGIPKRALKKSMITGGLIAFGIWIIQLFIFELYMNTWLGIEVFKQDIRVLIIVVSGLYIIFFFYSLRTKFLPEISEKSSQKIQLLLQSEIEKQVRYSNVIETEQVLDNQDSIPSLKSEEKIVRPPEGISFKIYSYFLKKFGKSRTEIPYQREEKILSESVFRKKFIKILVGISWVIIVGVFVITIFQIPVNPNLLLNVFFLSYMCALFMVLGDFSLTLLFNRINPIDKRVPKKVIQDTYLFGGLITFWIWMAPFFIIYTYLFVWMTETIILDITYIAVISIIIFLLSIRIVGWYATSIKMWIKSKRKAFYISLVSLIINIPLVMLVSLFLKTTFISDINSTFLLILLIDFVIVDVCIASIVVMMIYDKKFGESLKFILYVQIILLLVTIILNIVLDFFQSLIQIYNFNVQDIRILLVVATGIYIISIFSFSRIKFLPKSSEKIKERFRTIIQPTEEIQIQASMPVGNNAILDVQDLTTYFYTEEGVVKAVEGVSFKIYKGEVLGLVGETGCGKSVTALSILRLVRPPGEIKGGKVFFEGEDLHQKPENEFLSYRGNRITMIFQDPLNSLNPVFKIGDQISEVYRLHMEDELLIEAAKTDKSIYDVAREWSQQMLTDLNIPMPHLIFDRYPHELSGGMRQRVQIAMGLACSPKLLIADEPTTALDVTIQNQILQLMKDLKKKYNTSILFITHDLGIISKMCDRVAVMYSGFIVEYGDIEKLFIKPYHPYTKGLIASVPVVGKKKELLEIIPGTVPNLIYPPSGCRFHPRCQFCFEPCDSKIPKSIEVEPDYFVACHLYDPEYKDLIEKENRKSI